MKAEPQRSVVLEIAPSIPDLDDLPPTTGGPDGPPRKETWILDDGPLMDFAGLTQINIIL